MDKFEPDWSKAPEWANYWAVDDDGNSHWYQSKPIIRYDHGQWVTEQGEYIYDKFVKQEYWHDILYKRPAISSTVEVTLSKPLDKINITGLFDEVESKDSINPSHYKNGKVECIDAIESATVGKTGLEAVCTANVTKYLWRYETKNGLEDVKKAQWYLNRLVEHLESKES